MKKTSEKILFGVTLVLCVLLFAERLTGEIWHAVFGVLLIILIVGHTCKEFPKMKYRKTGIRVLDIVLIAALLVLFVTGMLMHPLQGVLILKILHKFAAVLFVLGIIGHMIQHLSKKGDKNVS